MQSSWATSISCCGAALLVAACGGHRGSAPAGDGDGGVAGGAGPDASGIPSAEGSAGDDSEGEAQSAAPQSYFRVAQLSPGLPPIDVCIALHGTTDFQGPLLALRFGHAGADAAPPGVGYAQVSAYVAVAPAQYDARIVAAGAVDCSTSLADTGARALDLDGGDADTVPNKVNLASFAPSAFATLLVAGEVSPVGEGRALVLTAIADDPALGGGAVAIRAVNALLTATSLDFGLGSFSTGWTPLLTDVGFGSAGVQAGPSVGVVDSNGYLPLSPLSGQTVSARASSGAMGDAVVAMHVMIESGSVATIIAVGGEPDDVAHPPALLVCIDNVPSGGLLSDCGIAP
jgi:hypothetical protein